MLQLARGRTEAEDPDVHGVVEGGPGLQVAGNVAGALDIAEGVPELGVGGIHLPHQLQPQQGLSGCQDLGLEF